MGIYKPYESIGKSMCFAVQPKLQQHQTPGLRELPTTARGLAIQSASASTLIQGRNFLEEFFLKKQENQMSSCKTPKFVGRWFLRDYTTYTTPYTTCHYPFCSRGIFRPMNSLAAEALNPSRSMNCSNRRGLDGFFHEAMAHGEFVDLPNLKMVIFYSKLLVYQKTLYYPGVRW